MVNAQIVEVKPQNVEIEKIKYRESLKFNRWAKLFTSKTINGEVNPIYGNATRCALAVYGTKSYYTAGRMGSDNYKKLRSIKEYILDNEGYGVVDLMKIGLAKVLKGDYEDWESFMIQMGYLQPQPKVGVAIQNNFNMADLQSAVSQSRKERGLQ
jgi:hypothetical protein